MKKNYYGQASLFEIEKEDCHKKTASFQVREQPWDEQPKNKIKENPSFLTSAELLSLLIGSSSKSDELSIAMDILSLYKEQGLQGLTNIEYHELASLKGMTDVKAARVIAAIELGRRIHRAESSRIEIVHGPEDAAHIAMPRFRFEKKEHFAIMMLNTKNHVIGMQTISVGGLNSTSVHPREVFQIAVKYSAATIILVHNHPSGDPTPSMEDIAITKRITKCGKIMDITVLDHIIIGNNRFASLKERGEMSD